VPFPHTQDWKDLFFTSFFVFLGVGIVGTALGIVLAWALDRDEKRKLLADSEVCRDYLQPD